MYRSRDWLFRQPEYQRTAKSAPRNLAVSLVYVAVRADCLCSQHRPLDELRSASWSLTLSDLSDVHRSYEDYPTQDRLEYRVGTCRTDVSHRYTQEQALSLLPRGRRLQACSSCTSRGKEQVPIMTDEERFMTRRNSLFLPSFVACSISVVNPIYVSCCAARGLVRRSVRRKGM